MEAFNSIIGGLTNFNNSGGLKVTTISKLDNEVYAKLGGSIVIAVIVAVLMSSMIKSIFSTK